MKNFVTVVAHPETGDVLNPRGDKGWSSFRVDSEAISFENGIVNISNRSAFISVSPDKRDQMEAFLSEGKKMPGKITRFLSRTPFYEMNGTPQSPVVYPDSSERAGEEVLRDGSPFYHMYTYTEDTNAPTDKWVNLEGTAETADEAADALTNS